MAYWWDNSDNMSEFVSEASALYGKSITELQEIIANQMKMIDDREKWIKDKEKIIKLLEDQLSALSKPKNLTPKERTGTSG
jgi:uncharacterized coiled-coil protein SlyX